MRGKTTEVHKILNGVNKGDNKKLCSLCENIRTLVSIFCQREHSFLLNLY